MVYIDKYMSIMCLSVSFASRPRLECGRMAERSKALVLGTSLFGGVGSNPTSAKFLLKYIFYFYF